MSRIPIVPHFEVGVSRGDRERVRRLADRLLTEEPDLRLPEAFSPLRLATDDDGPTLHLDDLSGIPLLDRYYDVSFIEDRARFRAFDGDWVAACGPSVDAFERYARRRLGLGAATWLHPLPSSGPLAVARACWSDIEVRTALLSALRDGRLRYLHPHMGNQAVWTLALLLSRESQRPLEVIAPPPGLTRAVNNKVWFADVVMRLFGCQAAPPTAHAWNLTSVAQRLHDLAPTSRRMVIKRPDSAGGAGNLVLESRRYRGLSVGELHAEARSLLEDFRWKGDVPLLVGSWQPDVLYTPSSQLWIPPPTDGPPLVEGIYLQMVEGPQGMFVGSRPYEFPPPLERQIVDRSWMLALLFQHLGYIGRCSFDMLLVGEELDACRLEFVECNGRWGGASAPMTLMNRLFDDWTVQPYAHRELVVPGIERLSFEEILEALGEELFDVRSGSGRFILYNPRALQTGRGIHCLALATDWRTAARLVTVDFPQRLERLVADRGPSAADELPNADSSAVDRDDLGP